MEPTKILSDEHRVIEVVLTCVESIAERAMLVHRLDRESAERAVDFIRNFADKCHHGKEETHLFAALAEKGMPSDSGPVAQMLHEHELGREFVRGMAENIEAAAAGDAKALRGFAANADGYVKLLRMHIMKEDNALFPMAELALSSDDKSRLIEAFEFVESEEMGHSTHARYIELAGELADECGVSKTSLAGKTCGCGH
jgi:hemerythrin-like domain-containing protein